MTTHRPITFIPDNEPLWIRLSVWQIGETWVAKIVVANAPVPRPGELKGLAFFRATAEEAERGAKAYLGCSEPGN